MLRKQRADNIRDRTGCRPIADQLLGWASGQFRNTPAEHNLLVWFDARGDGAAVGPKAQAAVAELLEQCHRGGRLLAEEGQNELTLLTIPNVDAESASIRHDGLRGGHDSISM